MSLFIDENYIGFSNDVYLITGYSRHCIYELKNGNLVSINSETKSLLEMCFTDEEIDLSLDTEQLTIINKFLDIGVLSKYDNNTFLTKNHNIYNIPKNKGDIKFAWIEVTRACNHACTFCYLDLDSTHMNLTEYKKTLNELKGLGIKNIQIIGGEPLILGDVLVEMLSYSQKLEMNVEIYTNGTLLDEKWIGVIKNFGIRIALSLHSHTPSIHNTLTKSRKGYEKTNVAIELLRKNNIEHRVSGVNVIDSNDSTNSEVVIKFEPPRATNKAIGKLYNYELFKRKAITRNSFYRPLKKEQVISSASGHQCFSEMLYISADLDVFPCVMERRISHGNIKNKLLQEVIDENIMGLNKDSVNECNLCEYRYACFDCRPDSLGQSVNSKPWYCTYSPKEGEWIDPESYYNSISNFLN